MTKLSFGQFAVSMENYGAQFYRAMAEKLVGEQIRGLLLYLAEEEDTHASNMNRLGEGNPSLDEAFAEITRARLFSIEQPDDVDELSRRFTSEEDVLKYAMELEKGSLKLYGELSRIVRDPALRRELESIIVEERKHFDELHALNQIQKRSSAQAFSSPDQEATALRDAVEEDHGRNKDDPFG